MVVALLYGSTLVLSPRDGVQPVEFTDEAFYSNLGAELARTGTESIYPPSGFSEIEGLPAQTWYHWGEMWLEAAVITVFGAAPLDARHFVVLPVMLLAAALLFTLDGKLIHHIGLPWHWGYMGVSVGDIVNDLTSLVGDPNVSMHEGKALMANIEKA